MMNISELLNGEMSEATLNGIAQQVGISKEDTTKVINASIPVLTGMLHKNASSDQGARGILGALSEHDGSIFENLSGFLNQGNTKDGEGILGHILGGNKKTVSKQLSKKTGVSTANVSKILALLAPIIMGYLGKQAKSSKVSTGGGLSDMLGGLLGGTDSSAGSDILNSVLESALGGGKKKSGLGGLLGGLFKK